MTSLAGINLHPSLQLEGRLNSKVSVGSVTGLLGGNNVIQMTPFNSGGEMQLIAVDGAFRMGVFCQLQLESLRAEANKAQPVTLVHPDGTYEVYIIDFNTTQWDEREPPGPDKKYSGSIILQEA